ncbi:MAG: CopG family transcriptional regulator [Treponema sp.]|nr:CopG family transcriptional regulator [Treponema sp.]
MPKGGFREGSGRKKLSESGRIQVQVSLQQDEIDLLKELAEKNGMTKSRFLVECVKFWKENH